MTAEDVVGVQPPRRLPGGRQVSSFLSARSPRGWSVDRCRAQVLRASRSRPVLRYRVSYVDAGREVSVEKIVIGKAYYRGDGAGTFDVMSELWRQGLTVPEPFGYVPELHLLLQGQAPGRPLYDHLEEPEQALAQAAASGRWLGRLHATPVRSARPLPEGFEAAKLAGYGADLAAARPDLAARFRTLAGRTAAAVAAPARPGDGHRPLVATHGDYQPKNIYVTAERVTVIDWDRFALAPSERDAGHFLGQCLTMSYSRTGSFTSIASWNEAFLQGYGEEVPAGPGPALAAYVARTFLEVLFYKLVVRPVRDAGFVPAWLDHCDALLESG